MTAARALQSGGAKTVIVHTGSIALWLDHLDHWASPAALTPADIVSPVGAGDAFWTGFLYAQIENKSLEDCVTIAQKLATIKLQNVGRLPDNINIKQIIHS